MDPNNLVQLLEGGRGLPLVDRFPEGNVLLPLGVESRDDLVDHGSLAAPIATMINVEYVVQGLESVHQLSRLAGRRLRLG